MLASLSVVGMNGGSKLTDEASNAREMVCCARVMIGIVAEFCGTQRVGRKEREALDCKDGRDTY